MGSLKDLLQNGAFSSLNRQERALDPSTIANNHRWWNALTKGENIFPLKAKGNHRKDTTRTIHE